MNDQRYCRLRVIGDNLDLAGSPAALRALAAVLRGAGPAIEVPIRNGAVAQERAAGPLAIALRGAPTLHFSGDDDGLAAVWAALEAVADETETAQPGGTAPHRHVEPDGSRSLVVTGEREDSPGLEDPLGL
ncbi:hypothetical protein [Dactylosporangium sp. NPDC051484]|uniref:Imm32 family immunity protein n=1 Tax=Dactylosporangium sp. NPDC051484 TaxID=3154942 RepID=UPI00344FD56B